MLVAVQAEDYHRGRALSSEVTRFLEELEGAGVAGVQKWAGSGAYDTGEESEVGWAAPWSSTEEDFGFYPESSGKPAWGLEQRSNMSRSAFSKDLSAATWGMGLRTGGMEGTSEAVLVSRLGLEKWREKEGDAASC